jgi:16S rRNA (cytosine1402-N4)-methyltransferase
MRPETYISQVLADLFSDCGEILGDVRLRRSPQDGSCMGIGWITFATTEASKKAVLKSGVRYPGGPKGRGINVTPATVTLATTAARERGSLQAAGTHTPAMCEETLRVLVLPDPDGIYVDGTFGRGGHSRAILSRLSSKGRLHAFDLDPEAINVGRELEKEDSRFRIHHKPFGHLAHVLEGEGLSGSISGVFLDLGISSPQFDSTNRGFRPEMDGPLDLRFDLTRGQSAYELLKSMDRLELRNMLIENGEADQVAARRIADAIAVAVAQGTLPDRTREFADLVLRAKGKEYQAMHPSKLTFQSLRVHINQEFAEIRRGIAAAFHVLKEDGRCGLLTWKHSECSIVMDCYRNYEIALPNAPLLNFLQSEHPKTAGKLKRRDAFDMDDVRRPTATEVRENSRARSALLHVMRKKIGIRALDVERAAYKKLGWDDPPEEPSVDKWRGWEKGK